LHIFQGEPLTTPDTCGVNRTCPDNDFDVCKVLDYSCPQGTVCELKTRVQWFDADKKVNWATWAAATFVDDNGGAADGSYTGDGRCNTGVDGDRCTATVTATVLGRGLRPRAYCGANPDRQSGYEYRGSSFRRLECEVTMSISPAPPLTTLGFSKSLQVSAPGAGTVAVASSTGAASKRVVGPAERPTRRPAFKPVSTTTSEAGPVTLKLKLSKKAKRKLKRKGKLKLPVTVTFTPLGGGDVITKTTRVKLAKPVKLP
jgi:hypothetical protein